MIKLLVFAVIVLAASGIGSVIALIIEDERIKKLVLREIRRQKDRDELYKLYHKDTAPDEEEPRADIFP